MTLYTRKPLTSEAFIFEGGAKSGEACAHWFKNLMGDDSATALYIPPTPPWVGEDGIASYPGQPECVLIVGVKDDFRVDPEYVLLYDDVRKTLDVVPKANFLEHFQEA